MGEQRYRSEGTGLWLVITNKLLTTMESQIFVESTPNIGSIFWFDLKLSIVSNSLETTRKLIDKIIGYSSKIKKILVVDDYWENRAVMINMLKSIGFELYEAVNGQDGLEQAIKFQPDLIITDLMMPVIDGFEMTRQLQQLLQNPLIIAVSASVLEADRQKSLALGCQDFLIKPFQGVELLNKIKECLSLSWIYDDNPETQLPGIDKNFAVTEMSIPPQDFLVALHEAAMGDDVEAVEQIIFKLDRLSPNHTIFANQLRELAEDFRFEELAHLVEDNLNMNKPFV